MKIRNVSHKGLRRLIEDDDGSRLDPQTVAKLKAMLSFLSQMDSVEELTAPPLWKAHQLTGDRKGIWSLFVTRNWRLTFRVTNEGEIGDLDFEDYH